MYEKYKNIHLNKILDLMSEHHRAKSLSRGKGSL